MFFKNYNPLVLNILKRAKFEAKFKLKSENIQLEHILLAILKSSKYSTFKLLNEYKFSYKSLLKLFKYNYLVGTTLNKKPKNFTFSLLAIEAIQNAEKIKKILQNNILSPDILLFATLNSHQNTRLLSVLNKQNLNVTELKCKLLNRLTKSVNKFIFPVAKKNLNNNYKKNFLSFYGFLRYKNDYLINLYYNKRYINSLLNKNNTTYSIGHQKIIEKITNILSLNEENHILVYGKPGVGKTTFMYNLVNYIEENEVSYNVLVKEFIEINLSELLVNISEDESFTSILKDTLKVTAILRNKIIIFDNLHLIFNPKQINATQSKGITAIRPFFTKKNLFNFIGIIDNLNYTEFIKSDSIFSRYAKSLELLPLNFNETLMIMNNLKRFYETYYGITITDEAIFSILDNSKQLASNYELPKKALIFLDEACSYLKYVLFSEDIDFKQLIFKLFLPQTQYLYNNSIKKKKYKLAQLFYMYEQSLYLFLNVFVKFIAEIFNSNKLILQNNVILYTFFTKLIEKGLFKLTPLESSKALSYFTQAKGPTLLSHEELVSLELNLQKNIIGQRNAIKYLVDAIRRDALKLRDKNRPIGTFLFVGPTGVGKTEMAKVLTKIVYKDESLLLRFDMSEYSEPHSVSKLIGITAGYKGFEEGGQLTNAVRKNPYSIILFDEIEKASDNFYNLLLQVLDEGRLTTGQGETINFTNTIIIITSNLGGEALLNKQLILDKFIEKGEILDKLGLLKITREDLTYDLFNDSENNEDQKENNIEQHLSNTTDHNINGTETKNKSILEAEIIDDSSKTNKKNQEVDIKVQKKDHENNTLDKIIIEKQKFIKKFNLEDESETSQENVLINSILKNGLTTYFEFLKENKISKRKNTTLMFKHLDPLLKKIFEEKELVKIGNTDKSKLISDKENISFDTTLKISKNLENNTYKEMTLNKNDITSYFNEEYCVNSDTDKNLFIDTIYDDEDEEYKALELKDAIIKMTNNREPGKLRKDIKSDIQILENDFINKLLEKRLPPEFINRLDAIILFDAFTKTDAYSISKLLLENFCKRMFELQKYKINYNIKIINKIVEKGYNITLGARPLKRALSEIIEIPFADFLLNNKLSENSFIYINIDEKDQILFLNA